MHSTHGATYVQRTTKRHCRGAVIAVAAASVLLAGCGGNDEPAGLDADASASSTPEDTAAPDDSPAESEGGDPTAAATPTTHEFADAGVTVVAPAASSPAEEAALATYVEFAHQWRKSLHDAQLSEMLPGLAAPSIVESVKDSLDYQTKNGIRYGGEMVIEPTIENSGDNVVILGGCVDGSGMTLIDDGEERPPDGVEENPLIPMNVVIGNSGAGWMVNENTLHE